MNKYFWRVIYQGGLEQNFKATSIIPIYIYLTDCGSWIGGIVKIVRLKCNPDKYSHIELQ